MGEQSMMSPSWACWRAALRLPSPKPPSSLVTWIVAASRGFEGTKFSMVKGKKSLLQMKNAGSFFGNLRNIITSLLF
jgi:hypothetical protein